MKKSPLIIPGLIILACSIALTACSKNSSSDSNSSVTLLTRSVWKYDTSGIDLNKDGTIEIADTLSACFKDNTYLFGKDSTVVMDEGATKCDGSDPQTSTYPWTITNGNPSILKSDVNAILQEGLKIRTLTDTKLLVYKDTTVLGVSLWYVFSLKH